MTKDALSPAGTLIPLTDEAQRALGDRSIVRFSRFPFRVGRESRASSTLFRLARDIERRIQVGPQLNDLYLLEPLSPRGCHISREHFVIDSLEHRFVLTDRNSTAGTRVGDQILGAGSKAIQADLRNGDVITVGSVHSPYRYRFGVSTT